MIAGDGEFGVCIDQLIENNRRWMKQLQMELAEKKAAMDTLTQECDLIRRKIDLLDNLLQSASRENLPGNEESSGSNGTKGCEREFCEQADLESTGIRETGDRLGSARDLSNHDTREENVIELRGDRLRNEVANILLKVYPQELYYREILQFLKERGYTVGGKDPGLNLIAHMAKDDRFQHGDKRGVYILSDYYAEKIQGSS
ncbi:MAG: hypothetical protein ACOX6I_10995 [Syntrophomonadaceae bacterium]|jgi:hypothetical protein